MYTYICLYLYIYTSIYVYTYICTYMYIIIDVNMCTYYTCTYIDIHIYIFANVYVFTIGIYTYPHNDYLMYSFPCLHVCKG